jgi:hypothetical protein
MEIAMMFLQTAARRIYIMISIIVNPVVMFAIQYHMVKVIIVINIMGASLLNVLGSMVTATVNMLTDVRQYWTAQWAIVGHVGISVALEPHVLTFSVFPPPKFPF